MGESNGAARGLLAVRLLKAHNKRPAGAEVLVDMKRAEAMVRGAVAEYVSAGVRIAQQSKQRRDAKTSRRK